MATIGQQLTTPETGWRRYDDTDSRIKYVGNWSTWSSSMCYNSSSKNITPASINDKYSFKFYGTKLRIIGISSIARSSLINVVIDGTVYSYSPKSSIAESDSTRVQRLLFEKTSLPNSIHTVEVYAVNFDGYLDIDAIDIDDIGDLLGTGIQLTAPETGWRRYDQKDSRLLFSNGTWNTDNANSPAYNGSQATSNSLGATCIFKFKGSKIRLIGTKDASFSNSIDIYIDNVLETTISEVYTSNVFQILLFEKIGLTNATHTIKFVNKTTNYIVVDAIDIDDTGYLIHPILNEVHSIGEIKNIGDCIPCMYTATTSGSTGIFSGLGDTTTSLIPTMSSATPNGSFYWVYIGKDYLGRKKFIADRDIQNLVSWDTLNSSGMCSENGITILSNNIIPTMTKNVESFGIASSSSVFTYNGHSFEPFYAFNKTLDDIQSWTAVGTSGWLAYDFLKQTKICGFSIKPLKDATYGVQQFPKNFTFEGWDGSNWIVISTYTNVTISSINDYKTFVIPECNYSKYRVNVSSITSGNLAIGELEFFYKVNQNLNCFIRLLTGGTSTTDTDNEWDKIIVNSTLGGIITAGDNNVWNWNGLKSWVSSTNSATGTNRMLRGGSLVSSFSAAGSGIIDATYAFRPVLLVEGFVNNMFLLMKNSNYYSIDPKYYDVVAHNFTPLTLTGGTDPNENDITNFAFKDLSVVTNSMTVGSDTFVPIDNFKDNFQIKLYLK